MNGFLMFRKACYIWAFWFVLNPFCMARCYSQNIYGQTDSIWSDFSFFCDPPFDVLNSVKGTRKGLFGEVFYESVEYAPQNKVASSVFGGEIIWEEHFFYISRLIRRISNNILEGIKDGIRVTGNSNNYTSYDPIFISVIEFIEPFFVLPILVDKLLQVAFYNSIKNGNFLLDCSTARKNVTSNISNIKLNWTVRTNPARKSNEYILDLHNFAYQGRGTDNSIIQTVRSDKEFITGSKGNNSCGRGRRKKGNKKKPAEDDYYTNPMVFIHCDNGVYYFSRDGINWFHFKDPKRRLNLPPYHF
jgi:hypothetical protein